MSSVCSGGDGEFNYNAATKDCKCCARAEEQEQREERDDWIMYKKKPDPPKKRGPKYIGCYEDNKDRNLPVEVGMDMSP